jgi:hypothetical protein
MVAAVRALEPRRVDTEDDDILLPFVVRTARRCDAISPAEAFTDAIIFGSTRVGVYRRRHAYAMDGWTPQSFDSFFLIGINLTIHYSSKTKGLSSKKV